eukprot:sb/3475613/
MVLSHAPSLHVFCCHDNGQMQQLREGDVKLEWPPVAACQGAMGDHPVFEIRSRSDRDRSHIQASALLLILDFTENTREYQHLRNTPTLFSDNLRVLGESSWSCEYGKIPADSSRCEMRRYLTFE